MSRSYRIVYEPLARAALQEVVFFIEEQSGPDRAKRWLRSLLESVGKLEALPKVFGVVTTRGGQPIYSKPVASYRVFYLVDDDTATVHVIDVVHTARETRLAIYRDDPLA